MLLHPWLAQLLMPDKHAVIFAIKGLIAIAMALFISMYLGLERPYWALVAAILLQIRPESGMVIEKALCLILGSLLGGAVGILILALLIPYPLLALASLTLWVSLNSAAAAMVHSKNFIYAFAMAGMTAALVVLLVMANAEAVSSKAVFDIAQARISEMTVGAVCAMLVSKLLWPMMVKDQMRDDARTVINRTLENLTFELDPQSSHDQRHDSAEQILETLVALADDSSAVVYESPEGPGRSRAAHLLSNKVLTLVALTQILGRFHRNHDNLLSPAFRQMLDSLRTHFRLVVATDSYDEAYRVAQALRRKLLEQRSAFVDESAIVTRLAGTALELASDLAVVLRAYNALENPDSTLLKAPKLSTHRDPLFGAINGFRTGMVFLFGAAVWVAAASPSAILMMIVPVMFSVTFANFSLAFLKAFLRRLLLGVVVSVPVALVFGLALLSQSSGDFEILILVLAGPYFIGLLALANRETLPCGLGFCIPLTLIIQPGNNMTFNAADAANNALGLLVGIGALYWIFQLIAPPDSQLMKRRLLHATARDLVDLNNHPTPERWYNGRMGERLLRLANYDQENKRSERFMTDLGFTGLNLGHTSIRLRKLVHKRRGPLVDAELRYWQQVLADTYLMSSRGEFNPEFRVASDRLLQAVHSVDSPDQQTVIIEGMFERIALTFERTARTVASLTKS